MSLPRRPSWLKVKLPGAGRYAEVRKRLGALHLHTVCEEARCPNLGECWGSGTATFLILGAVCTRGCRFCDVTSGRPAAPPDADEPARVAQAVAELRLRHAVITSVDRDDLPDGGAAHFAATVRAIRALSPQVRIELLTPDFRGDRAALQTAAASGAEVLGHNIETVRRLTPQLRDARCSYEQSLAVLRTYRAVDRAVIVKSACSVGLGETDDELRQTFDDLRAAGVDWVAFGQYLQPSRKHAPVQRYVSPAAFEDLAATARAAGFALVSAGPLVRSSYRAAEAEVDALLSRPPAPAAR